jgi:hypothetical protein
MSCGCAKAPDYVADGATMVSPQYQAASKPRANEDCPYTIEQVDDWYIKVNCFKDGGFYVNFPNITTTQLNLYIGTLLSVQNFRGNICYFTAELEEISNFIMVITSMNICTS